jgi:selenide,water dikinase
VPQDLNEIAFDPQTSGGLLIAVPGREGEPLVHELLSEGIQAAAVIGEVVPHTEAWVEIV